MQGYKLLIVLVNGVPVGSTPFDGRAKALFEEDLQVAREYDVRGFPTIFFINNRGEGELVYGSKPYPFFETAILKLDPNAP